MSARESFIVFVHTESNPRAQLYGLLARLLLDQLDRPLAIYLRGLPGLAEHIPADAELGDWLTDMRAEHQRLFGLNIYPYESIFRDRELMLNSAAAQPVAALYQACGFAPAAHLAAAAPDHLGLELALMAELAARAPRDTAAHRHMATLLRDHLAAWLPACAEAIGRAARAPLHRALAEIAVDLVLGDLETVVSLPPHPQPLSHRGSGEPDSSDIEAPDLPLSHQGSGEPDSAQRELGASHFQAQNLPLSPAWERGPGGEGNPDLRQIVRRLLTPDEIGVFICRADIAATGRALGLPTPIAEREHMLLGLFEAAGRFEQVPALLGALGERLCAADMTYASLAGAHPAWEVHSRAWRGRVADGLGLLEKLAADLQKIEDRG
jgi:TorA maturation chaperone TorD